MSRVPSRQLFPTDEPIPAPDMIGRAADVDELVAQLRGGVHRVVAAPRRTGKSTVCRAAIDSLAAAGAYTVSVSLFELTSPASLAERLAQRAVANRGSLAQLVERVRAGGEAVLKGSALTLSMRASADLGEGVELALRPGLARVDPHSALLTSLRLLQRIAAADDRHLVLFIDELQEIASGDYGSADGLTREVREILADSPLVTCLFAGSVEHLMRELFSSRQRAFYGFGGFHDLDTITAEEWIEGLTARFADDLVTCEPGAIARILGVSGGHPRATMLIAQQAHVALVEQDAYVFDIGEAERGVAGAMAAERARHADALLDARRNGPAAMRVLSNLARHAPTYANVETKAARRALEALTRNGLVSRGTGRGEWWINDPLLAHYMAAALAPS